MLDGLSVAHQRSRGVARVAIGASGQVTDLFQQGSGKAMLPAVHSDVPEVVFLNTSGGLTGGDRLSFDLTVADGASVMSATQTAERVYASASGAAKADVRIRVGAGATCFWLPQETIVFEQGALARTTDVELAADARFLGIETLVLGREAMGETVRAAMIDDVRRVRRDGKLVHAEQIGLDADVFENSAEDAGLARKTVVSSLVYLAPDAADWLEPVRREIGDAAAASAWNERLVVRMIHTDSWVVRQIMARAIALLAGRVPRVWQM